jgi:hypothetical protein
MNYAAYISPKDRLNTAQADAYPEMEARQEPLYGKQDEFLGVLSHATAALTDCDELYIHQSGHAEQVYVHHAAAVLDHGLTWNQNFN